MCACIGQSFRPPIRQVWGEVYDAMDPQAVLAALDVIELRFSAEPTRIRGLYIRRGKPT